MAAPGPAAQQTQSPPSQQPAPPRPASPGQPEQEKPKSEEKPPIPAFEELVVVTASKIEQKLVNAPAAVSLISGEVIQASPAQSYADLFRAVPGVNVAPTSARDINVTSRGATSTLSTSQLALMDGRSIYQDFFGFVAWDFLPINFDEIKQIEVIRGPASAVWGANARTGVINVIPKSPREALRAIAGFFVLASLALGWWVHPGFYLFTAFVGLNLFQSAFTRWCPMMTFLRMAGVKSDAMARMMMIVVDRAVRAEVEVLLRKSGAHGYTELGPATGWGESGLRLASGAYPKASIVLFTALDPEAEKQVRIALTGFEAGASQRIRAYAWDVEEVA